MTESLLAVEPSIGIAEQEVVSQYLTFQCAGERLAINILEVKELIEVTHMTSVPMTPNYIRGVINLRGSVVPIIDLSARLSQQPCELTKRSSIVLVDASHETNSQILGMLVDEVNEILEIDASAIQPAPSFGAHIRTDFIQAMGNVKDEFIILLATDKVLSVEELAALKQISDTNAPDRECHQAE